MIAPYDPARCGHIFRRDRRDDLREFVDGTRDHQMLEGPCARECEGDGLERPRQFFVARNRDHDPERRAGDWCHVSWLIEPARKRADLLSHAFRQGAGKRKPEQLAMPFIEPGQSVGTERSDAKTAARKMFYQALAHETVHGVTDRCAAGTEFMREPVEVEYHAGRVGSRDDLLPDEAMDMMCCHGFGGHHDSPSYGQQPVRLPRFSPRSEAPRSVRAGPLTAYQPPAGAVPTRSCTVTACLQAETAGLSIAISGAPWPYGNESAASLGLALFQMPAKWSSRRPIFFRPSGVRLTRT